MAHDVEDHYNNVTSVEDAFAQNLRDEAVTGECDGDNLENRVDQLTDKVGVLIGLLDQLSEDQLGQLIGYQWSRTNSAD